MKQCTIMVICAGASISIGAPGYYPFYYQPGFFFGEPRLQESRMTTFSAQLAGGHARCGYDCVRNHVNVLGLYGDENIHALARGVPTTCMPATCGTFLHDISQQTPALDNFGTMSCLARASMVICILGWTQNFKRGFFSGVSLLAGRTEIKNVRYVDYTTKASTGPGINYIQWQDFFNHFDERLACYGLDVGPQHCSGIGDLQLWAGWTKNYEDTTYLDYIDGTLAVGVSCPTSKKPSASAIFALPLGYDGHVGIPAYASMSFGVWDWFTAGANLAAMFFAHKTRCVGLKTDPEQSGMIRLARAPARVQRGNIWHGDVYVKADHVIDGLSLILDFAYDHALRTRVCPCDRTLNVYTDQRWASWSMATFHFVFDYDAATLARPYLPHVGFTVDTVMRGRRVLDSTFFGTTIGCDLSWKF